MKKISILLLFAAIIMVACQNPSAEVATDKEPEKVAEATPKQNTPPPPPPPSERLPELKPEEVKLEEMGLYSQLRNLFPYEKGTFSDQDSINIMSVAKYIYLIDMVEKPPMRSFRPRPGEKLQEVRRNGEVVRIIHEQETDSYNRQQRYYIRDGKVVYFRKREWQKTTVPPFASETYGFFIDGKIVKALGRKTNLEVGSSPVPLARVNVTTIDEKSKKALVAEVESRWLEVQNYLNGDF
jgi:hypothetical protein